VREEELEGNRLKFTRLTGTGPEIGWASISAKQKPLLELVSEGELGAALPRIEPSSSAELPGDDASIPSSTAVEPTSPAPIVGPHEAESAESAEFAAAAASSAATQDSTSVPAAEPDTTAVDSGQYVGASADRQHDPGVDAKGAAVADHVAASADAKLDPEGDAEERAAVAGHAAASADAERDPSRDAQELDQIIVRPDASAPAVEQHELDASGASSEICCEQPSPPGDAPAEGQSASSAEADQHGRSTNLSNAGACETGASQPAIASEPEAGTEAGTEAEPPPTELSENELCASNSHGVPNGSSDAQPQPVVDVALKIPALDLPHVRKGKQQARPEEVSQKVHRSPGVESIEQEETKASRDCSGVNLFGSATSRPEPASGPAKPAEQVAPSWLGRLLNSFCEPAAQQEVGTRREALPLVSIRDRKMQMSLAKMLGEAAGALSTDDEIQEAGQLAVKLQDAAFALLQRFEESASRKALMSQENAEGDSSSEVLRSGQACCSFGCQYAVHSSDKYGSYCCVGCYDTFGADHGDRCERRILQEKSSVEKGEPELKESTDKDASEADASKPAGDGIEGGEEASEAARAEDTKREPEVEQSKEEAAAKAAIEEARHLAKKIQDAALALLHETSHEKAAEASASSEGQVGSKGQDLLGNAVPGRKIGDKLAMVKTLQDAASVLLKDGLFEHAGKLAKKLQDTAFILLTEDLAKTADADDAGDAETKKSVKHAESDLKEDVPKTLQEWRAEVAKHRRSKDQVSLAQTCQDASIAFLKECNFKEARNFSKDAESVYRSMGSRWRLGVVLDTLASAHLQLFKQLQSSEHSQDGSGQKVLETNSGKEHSKAALEAANEAVSLLSKIGHPKEEVDLARARSTLAAVRELVGSSGPAASPQGSQQMQSNGASRAPGDKKGDLKTWQDTVARHRRLFRQAPEGRGDSEGFAQSLQSASLAFLKHGAPEDAKQVAEEAVSLYRQLRAAMRLGMALDTVAKAHLACRVAVQRSDRTDASLWERQHQLKAKTAATEAVTILSQRTTADWLAACVKARCTLLSVRALEHPDSGSQGAAGLRDLKLKKTFGYAGGLEKPIPFTRFDVRNDVCLRVGGFTHGQLVKDQDGHEYVAVGVKLSDDDEKVPQLWFQPKAVDGKASCCFPSLPLGLLSSLLSSTGTEQLKEVRPEEFDAAEDSEGELVTLCHECVLPVGASRYPCQDEAGVYHGECMAKILLDASKAEDTARESEETKKKIKDRQEYNIGWKPEKMISRNIEVARRRRIPHPQGAKQDTMFCLMLEGNDPPKLRLMPTTDPEAFVNLSYLLTSLQVRIRAGMAPYFSLDTPNSDEAWQVKTHGPPWIKGTDVGEVLFQADYHLKELSMGDSLFEPPTIGMRNCWDFAWNSEGWRGREWFVVKHAKVSLSENNVLLPHVEMGVEAREQVVNAQKQLVDAPVTSTTHPLVKYADMFSHNFDLIAERKSVVYQLREVSKAAVIAKFLVDNKVALDECWLSPEEGSSLCKMDLPFNKKERFFYEILVRDGAIHEHHGGVLSSMVGLYGGVDLNIDAFDLSMPIHRLSRSVKMPDYSAIYADPGQMGNSSELSRLSTRELRRLIQQNGGESSRGPVDKADLIEQLLKVCPQAPAEAAAAAGEEQDDAGLPYAAALAEDLRGLALPEESVSAVLRAVRARAIGETPPTQVPPNAQKDFWESLDDGSSKASLFKAIFKSRLADRQQEGAFFVPPVGKEAYLKKLQMLVDEERQVQDDRRKHFFSKDFVTSVPGPLFPSSWKPTFSMHFARGSSVAAGGDAARSRQLEESALDPSELLKQRPIFDRSTEDRVRFRIYRRGTLEVRTTQEEGDDSKEDVGAVFEARAAAPPGDHHPVVKATEFVMIVDVGEAASEQMYRYFVVYETDLGDVSFTEKLGEGAASWEDNPVDMEERYACARVLRVTDCSGGGIIVGRLKQLHADGASSGLSSRRYAQRAFELAGGTPLAQPASLAAPAAAPLAPVPAPALRPAVGAPPAPGLGSRSWLPQVFQGRPRW